jgi:hypothetical protein
VKDDIIIKGKIRTIESTQFKQKKKKKTEKRIRASGICGPMEFQKRDNESKKALVEIMADNFINLLKNHKPTHLRS